MRKHLLVNLEKVSLSFSKDVLQKIETRELELEDILNLLEEEVQWIPKNGTFFITNEFLVLSGSMKNDQQIQVDVGIMMDNLRVFMV